MEKGMEKGMGKGTGLGMSICTVIAPKMIAGWKVLYRVPGQPIGSVVHMTEDKIVFCLC